MNSLDKLWLKIKLYRIYCLIITEIKINHNKKYASIYHLSNKPCYIIIFDMLIEFI